MSSDPRTVAVLDLGSARTKLLLATQLENGVVSYDRRAIETGFSALVSADGTFPADVVSRLVSAVCEFKEYAKTVRSEVLAAVATEALRRAPNEAAIRDLLTRETGVVVAILSWQAEAGLFHQGVSSVVQAADVVADIGGGSIQISWGADAASAASLPLGTFALERQFQAGSPATVAELHAMRQALDAALASAVPKGQVRRLVIGSNVMRDFFGALFDALGLFMAEDGEVKMSDVARALQFLAGKPYDSIEHLYPANPYFLRGADKALVSISAIADWFGASHIVPTNESVSTAIARLLLNGSSAIGEFGITTGALSR